MISRLQKILFFFLLISSLVMAGILLHLRSRAHQRLLAGQDSAPTEAPQVAPTVQATLMVPDDNDNSMRAQIRSLPLPADAGARAHALLARLFDIYAAPDATHPVAGGASGIAQVFLLPAPEATAAQQRSSAQLAVVNLTSAFANDHPSGIETEMLTIQSICSTLHANLPQIIEVRFLVDGQVRPTLAGHADLTRTYLAQDSASVGVPAQ